MEKITRTTHILDAKNKTVGRLGSSIAVILRGKNKPEFDPSLDIGDIVKITNIDKLKFTGKKFEQKNYHNFSGYLGGLKSRSMKKIYLTKPEEVLKRAVFEMLPPVKFRPAMMKRLIFTSK